MEDALAPILGETVWHTLVHDPSLAQVSEAHYRDVSRVLHRHGRALPRGMQVLEAGAYAHTTAYALAQRLGARATALDLSTTTLRAGGRLAAEQGLPLERTRRIAADLHALPFADAQFHFVYLCATLHHASDWTAALGELLRVVAPGGLLYLQNEPCLRELCFYRFRTNRADALTPFESALDRLGALRTVAEPHLGSRPETLFGMVENQTIALDALAERIRACSEIVELRVVPEQCMGGLEREILRLPGMRSEDIEAWLVAKLAALFAQSARSLGPLERGLGFSLPASADIRSLCARLAPRVAALPKGLHALVLLRLERILLRASAGRWPRHSSALRMELARLFGAGVSVVAQKRGAANAPVEGRLSEAFPEDDGVVLAFRPEVRQMIDARHRLLPDLQKVSEAEIRRAFPGEDWDLHRAANGFRSVVARRSRARIVCALPAVPLRIFFGVHASRGEVPYRLRLLHGERELAAAEVHQTESLLLAGRTAATESSAELAVSVTAPGRIAISSAGSAPV